MKATVREQKEDFGYKKTVTMDMEIKQREMMYRLMIRFVIVIVSDRD